MTQVKTTTAHFTAMTLKAGTKAHILRHHKQYTERFGISRKTLYNWVNDTSMVGPAYSYAFLHFTANMLNCQIPEMLEFIYGKTTLQTKTQVEL